MRDLPPIVGELDHLQLQSTKEANSMPAQFGQPSLPAVSKTMPHFCPAPSPSMNEAAVGEIAPGDYTLQLGFEALKAVRVAAENTTTACRAIHSDSTLSEGARHVSADAVSFKVTNKALPLVDKATQNFSTEIQRLKNKIAAPAQDNTIRGVQLATELRIFLRDQSSADRRKEITRSLEAGDDQTMSAILSAPPMLSGLSEPEVRGFATMWRLKRWPAEVARIAQLEKAADVVSLGGQLLISHQRKMAAAAIVAEAKKFQQASADAVRAATGSN